MNKSKYYINERDEFVIENYNSAPVFSSFLPGIAGLYGCPMWVFYANRGQCITSFGVNDKNGALLEFQPANKAYRNVALNGFRTFIKVNGKFYEPFAEGALSENEMRISPESLTISEENRSLKLKVEVTYFTVPGTDFPALARALKITNLSSRTVKIEIADGLPTLVPSGFDNDLIKRLSQTISAWCEVKNIERAPFYKLKAMPADITETRFLETGHFFASNAALLKKAPSVKYIVDPSVLFGEIKSLQFPESFARHDFRLPADQQTEGFLPSAFGYVKTSLPGKETISLNSLFGQAADPATASQIRKLATAKFFVAKLDENKKLIEAICSPLKTQSGSRQFDLYARQTFLDNVMRGGLPVELGGRVFYAYFRKHGDMERDYNDFKLRPGYFSQGDGNYRDINQNRRNDVFFSPAAGEDNLRRFFNLIQLDGFNPLVVLGTRYVLNSEADARALVEKHIESPSVELAAAIGQPFVLGELVKDLKYKTSREAFVEALLSAATPINEAQHGEGFWTDHFAYNTDLLESFEAVFPDRLKALLFEEKSFTYYDNDHVVMPRQDKIVGQRQVESVRIDPEKSSLINRRSELKNLVRTKFGQGEVLRTTLIAKIICLAANKAASFDAAGIGLEMEADKPDWYDALNGLPALFGSSLSETLELKRLCVFTLKYLPAKGKFLIPVEIKLFAERLNQGNDNELKEEFRRLTRLGVSGEESSLDAAEIKEFFENIIKRCDAGVAKGLKQFGNYYTYFINGQKNLPLFLEGFVHALRVNGDKSIYKRVKASPLYDQKLGMYKVNAPLATAPVEIGRARIFTPGWLENESVWLHMEYKYLLELLKAGLYDEFFGDFKRIAVPFLDPKKYGRSNLENSSFIVSSAHPDKRRHGRGFYARLSGASTEFIDMWVIMATGKKIFSLDQNGKLNFRLSPVLPAWLFKNGRFSFKLFGSIEVEYVNQKKKDSFGLSPLSYNLTLTDGKEVKVTGSVITGELPALIRARKVKKIVANLS